MVGAFHGVVRCVGEHGAIAPISARIAAVGRPGGCGPGRHLRFWTLVAAVSPLVGAPLQHLDALRPRHGNVRPAQSSGRWMVPPRVGGFHLLLRATKDEAVRHAHSAAMTRCEPRFLAASDELPGRGIGRRVELQAFGGPCGVLSVSVHGRFCTHSAP